MILDDVSIGTLGGLSQLWLFVEFKPSFNVCFEVVQSIQFLIVDKIIVILIILLGIPNCQRSMHMLIYIKLLVFALSNIGLWEIIRRNTHINPFFLPGLTIAIQTSFLFFAGLLNLLPEASNTLYLLGLISIVFFLLKDKKLRFIQHYFSVGFLYFSVVLFLLCIFLKGQVFTHYDNFSHWALVVRNMLTTNRYPNFESTLITFQAYPLGSATYIYFFSKLISPSESVQMLAQAYMLISSILPLFFYVKKNRMISTLVISAATIWFLTYSIQITDLLVDTLLPLVAMAGLLYSCIYSKHANQNLEMLGASFYMIQLVLIKNSGLYFVILISLQILLNLRSCNKTRYRLFCISLPLFALLL